LIPTRYFVCASPNYLQQYGHPRSPQEIEHHNCLLFPLAGFRSQWRFRDAKGQECEVMVRGRTTISNAVALAQCAIAGMGVALLPHWLIDDDLRDGRLVDIFPAYAVTATEFNTAAWMVYPSRTYVPIKVRVLMDFLKQSIVSTHPN
jgi:DNA-binding transcriptional LysR family regulator